MKKSKKEKEVEVAVSLVDTAGCRVFFNRVEIEFLISADINVRPDGYHYAVLEAYYNQANCERLTKFCWEHTRGEFKITNAAGEVFPEFKRWGLLVAMDTQLRVDKMVTNHFTIQLLNKIK